MHPIPVIDSCLFIDNSSLERFTTCPRSSQYYLCQKRESADSRSALTFGKIIHNALEIRYRNLTMPLPAVTTLMLDSLTTAFSTWSPPEDDHRNIDTAIKVITSYLATYPIEEFSITSLPSGAPAVELPFAVPLGDITINGPLLIRNPDGSTETRHFTTLTIIWQGRIDLIYSSQGRTYIMDHKTTSMLGPSYFKEFELSHQVYGYVWATSALLKRSISGFAINALAIRKPTKTGKGIEFIRQVIPLEQTLLEEWVDDTLHICSDFVEHARRGYFPKHTKWCVGKYGECPYRGVCSMPPAHREMFLASGLFKTVDWSPLT